MFFIWKKADVEILSKLLSLNKNMNFTQSQFRISAIRSDNRHVIPQDYAKIAAITVGKILIEQNYFPVYTFPPDYIERLWDAIEDIDPAFAEKYGELKRSLKAQTDVDSQ